MYVFIAIILIAELIIASTLLYFINKIDKKACELSDRIAILRPEIERKLIMFKDFVNKSGDSINNMIKYAKIRREKYMFGAIKSLLMYVLLFTLKGRSRKIASGLRFAIAFMDFWDRIPVL